MRMLTWTILLLFSIALVGCGGDESANSNSEPDTPDLNIDTGELQPVGDLDANGDDSDDGQ